MNLDDNDFALFGLPEKFDIDRADLDARWRNLQSYRRLREPLARAAYLCELRGAPIAAHSNTAMPVAFLRQQIAWREALDDADSGAALAALEAQVRVAEADLLSQLAALLDEQALPVQAAERVRALMFIQRLRVDLDQRLDALHP